MPIICIIGALPHVGLRFGGGRDEMTTTITTRSRLVVVMRGDYPTVLLLGQSNGCLLLEILNGDALL